MSTKIPLAKKIRILVAPTVLEVFFMSMLCLALMAYTLFVSYRLTHPEVSRIEMFLSEYLGGATLWIVGVADILIGSADAATAAVWAIVGLVSYFLVNLFTSSARELWLTLTIALNHTHPGRHGLLRYWKEFFRTKLIFGAMTTACLIYSVIVFSFTAPWLSGSFVEAVSDPNTTNVVIAAASALAFVLLLHGIVVFLRLLMPLPYLQSQFYE